MTITGRGFPVVPPKRAAQAPEDWLNPSYRTSENADFEVADCYLIGDEYQTVPELMERLRE